MYRLILLTGYRSTAWRVEKGKRVKEENRTESAEERAVEERAVEERLDSVKNVKKQEELVDGNYIYLI